MQANKKILLVLQDNAVKRVLAFALVDLGFDVRAFGNRADALTCAQREWFDLAVLDPASNDAGKEEALAAALKRSQPAMPIILLVPTLDLTVVLQGIRLSLEDMVEFRGDLLPVVHQVVTRLTDGLEWTEASLPSAEELKEVEAVLARHQTESAGQGATTLRTVRQLARLEVQVQQLTQEKATLEAELRSAQEREGPRKPQDDFNELRIQKEIMQAKESYIDDKARALAKQREDIAQERAELAALKQQVGNLRALDQNETLQLLQAEREEIRSALASVAEEQSRIKKETERLRREAAKIQDERRGLQEDQEALREQEANLRNYEQRLRQQQTAMEAERVSQAGSRASFPVNPFDDEGLRMAWGKIHRATEILEVERSNFNEEKLALRDREAAIKLREERLREAELQNLSLDIKGRATIAPFASTSGASGRTAPPFASTSSPSGRTAAPFSPSGGRPPGTAGPFAFKLTSSSPAKAAAGGDPTPAAPKDAAAFAPAPITGEVAAPSAPTLPPDAPTKVDAHPEHDGSGPGKGLRDLSRSPFALARSLLSRGK